MRWPFGKKAKEQDLEDEILAHLAIEAKRRMEQGESPPEAERAARRGFGNVARVKERVREEWGSGWVDSLGQDVRYGMRAIRKSPAASAIAILTMSFGIGASSAAFDIVNRVLLRPLPYAEPQRIAMLWRIAPLRLAFGSESYPWSKREFSMLREQARSFESLGAFKADSFNLTGAGDPVMLEGMRATAGFFESLGVAPALGRVFTADEDRRGRDRVVVLGDRLWRERFHADPGILGKPIELSGFGYTVAGVMPPGFSFPHAEEIPATLEFPKEAQLWAPLAIAPSDRGPNELVVIGRMRKGLPLSRAQSDLDAFGRKFTELIPSAKAWAKSRAIPLREQIVGDSEKPLSLVLAAAALVLLIACSNVAGLSLTRSLGRQREFELRAALGAGRGRLIQQVVTESLLLGLCSGALGFGLAAAGIEMVRIWGPPNLPRIREVALDPAAFVFCAAIALVTSVSFGIAPGIRRRNNLADSLRSRSGGAAFSPLLRKALLVGQIAMALVLTAAAGLLSRTLYGLMHVQPGFRTERVLTFELSLPESRYPDPDRMAQVYSRALESLRALPGIESTGLVHATPMGGAPDATSIRVPGHTSRPNEQLYANYMFASAGYFKAVQTALLRGRDFRDGDTLESQRVTIVNRAMADALWPGEDAVGKQVGVADVRFPVRNVIGVVENVKQNSLREKVTPQMYVPFTQDEIKVWPPMQTMEVAVRTAADPGQMTDAIRRAIHAVDPALPVAKVETLESLVRRSLAQPRFAALLIAVFGGLALALASIGMYGVISHAVAQRTHEIGVRMALGAGRGQVFAMVLADGARLAAVGIAIGLAAALAGMRSLASFLYDVRPADPWTLALGSALLAAVALLACYVPARRATTVNPATALRGE